MRPQKLEMLVAACGLLCTLWLASACGRQYRVVSTAAMTPTIWVGDRVVVRALDEGEPKRGDVVVFVYRESDARAASSMWIPMARPYEFDGEELLMRVVALPGDRIRIEDDVIMLNGVPIETQRLGSGMCVGDPNNENSRARGCTCERQRETIGTRTWVTQHHLSGCPADLSGNWPQELIPFSPYLGAKASNPTWPDVVVPDEHVLILGDYRDGAMDGRYIGFVPMAAIGGKVVWVQSNKFEPTREDIPLD